MAPNKKCGSCEALVKKNESFAECGACKKHFHGRCTQLSDEEFPMASPKSRLKWFCDICNSDVIDMLCNYDKFRKVSAHIEKIKEDIDSKLKDVEKRIAGVEVAASGKVVAEKIEEQVKKSAENDKVEIDLIRSKEQNLIYFNVPESHEENVGERMKYDFKILSSAYNEEIEHNQITNLYRVGKRSDGTRPLVVKFDSVEIKNKFLKKSGGLSVKHQNEVRKIYASIDRTEKQRQIHKNLVQQLKERRLKGEENLVIRGEKIVKNFRMESAAERITWSSLFSSQI